MSNHVMRLTSVVVTIGLAAAVSLLVQAAYKPLEPEEDSGTFVDGKPAPTTISDLKADAEAVVLVIYWGHRRTLACRPPCLVRSLHAMEIREVLKAHPLLLKGRRRFELELMGGVEELPNSIRPHVR